MIPFQPLNGMQKMMLRWEQFHPLNASHVVELGRPVSLPAVERAVRQTTRRLGLCPVEFNRSLRGFRFAECAGDNPPPFEHFFCTNSAQEALRQILDEQLNRPFESGSHWPVRFLLIETPGTAQHLAIIYQHVVSDSRGISLIVRELLRALFDESPDTGSLVYYPKHLRQLFPAELGWRNLPRLARETLREFTTSACCYKLGQRTGAPRLIASGLHETNLSTALVKQTARRLGAKVQDLLFAAFLEGVSLLLKDELHRSRRKTLAVIAPVDLRREAPENMDSSFTQLLGSINVRLPIQPETPFSQIVPSVLAQTQAVKQQRGYRTHAAQLEAMSWGWDVAPRWMNRRAGPTWFPYMGLISNVNLTDFIADQLASGVVRNYFRFTGTGLMVPMMLGVTTLGPMINVTSTHHTDEFRAAEVQLLIRHLQARITGQLADRITRDEFLEGPPVQQPALSEVLVA